MANTLMEINAIGSSIADANTDNLTTTQRAIYPYTYFGVFDPQVLNRSIVQRAADAVEFGIIIAVHHLTENSKIRELHIFTGSSALITINADAVAVQHRVPRT